MYIYIGTIVTTHGLKGELKIKSTFKDKKNAFKLNNNLYIGENKEKTQILTYRVHQNYDMVTLEGINDIDKAVQYKQKKVYIIKGKNTLYNEDLIGMEVYSKGKLIGKVTEVIEGYQDIIVIDNNHMIPYVKEYIKKIDKQKRIINIEEIEGLINSIK